MLNSQTITYEQLAKTIDHSLLRPELTRQEAIEGCEVAARYNVASVCVKPSHVRLACDVLRGTSVAIGTVIGFPHGAHLTAIKVAETQRALEDGATEFDMVINIGDLRSGEHQAVLEDIRAVVHAAAGNIVKVILENAYLNDEQKVLACQLSEQAGAHFVKTSTGFAPSGATVEDVRLMRASVSSKVQVKAAGGIRTLESALAMIDAGATRIGATATAAILDAFRARQEAHG